MGSAKCQDLPSVSTADPEVVTQLTRENAELRQRLDRAIVEARNAEEIANEALSLWPPTAPTPPESGSQTPGTGGSPGSAGSSPVASGSEGVALKGLTERDFPPAPEGPARPRTPDDVPSFPDPERTPDPQPAQPPVERPRGPRSKGFRVTQAAPPRPQLVSATPVVAAAPPAIAPPPERTSVRDQGIAPGPAPTVTPYVPTVTDTDLELLSLDAILYNIKRGPRTPALTITRRALKDYADLSLDERRAVVDMFCTLAQQPEAVRQTRIGQKGSGVYALRATRRLRVICLKEHEASGTTLWHVQEIADRGDSVIFKRER